ncbi:energy transducer TonB [Pseudomonas helleri]|uniref:TonB family protein n=1 Tax=Pseudomonas helleri TaxID=1608996 RepID=A0A7X1Y837_9PSED|nr:TonB family protein [Pseudomonas helleri]
MGKVHTASAVPDALWRPAPVGDLLDLGRAYREPLALGRLQSTPKRILSRPEAVLIGVLALALHGAVIYWISQNPAPEYPSLAMRRGWEGTVLLRVHVLASGKPGEIQIQKSSGRTQLDDAALAAVKRWSFVPAKQGDVAQDGWVSVPIDFKIK